MDGWVDGLAGRQSGCWWMDWPDAETRMRECANARMHTGTSPRGRRGLGGGGGRRLDRRRDVNPRRRTSSLSWIGLASLTGVCICIIGTIFFLFWLLLWAAFFVVFRQKVQLVRGPIMAGTPEPPTRCSRSNLSQHPAGLTTPSHAFSASRSSGALLREMQHRQGFIGCALF